MSEVKEILKKIIEEQPEDSTYDEILRELAFRSMIDRGLKDSDNGKTISHEEMKRRLKAWQK